LAKGCHKLIREGAHLVETVDEVLEALRLSPLARPVAPIPAPEPGSLLERLGFDPIGFDALAAATGEQASSLNSQLLLLEMAGLVERLPGGFVSRVVR
jgi:DNA processing protein